MVKVDSGTGLALLVVRDGDTGKEVEQYPSRHVVEEYKRNIPTAIDQTQTAIKAQAAEDVKAPPAPVAAAPSAPAAHAAPAPSGGSVKI
ncbi:hypothetical protein WV31_15760 [Magnetospirillum sp. ME-1]|nr:hypothetical protein WV31_15760 [Magnetospirillum sp. ME-1]